MRLPSVALACLGLLISACHAPLQPDEVVHDSVEEAAPLNQRPMNRGGRLCQDGVTYVVSEDPKLPLVRYQDGQVALSDSCAVRIGSRLNRKVPPAYVNGQPLGFC